MSTNATGNLLADGAAGTIDNPLDGSTATNFDSNMQSFFIGHAHATMHLLAGTFQTDGSVGSPGWNYWPKPGMRVLGSGIDVTILKLVVPPSCPQYSDAWLFESCCGYDATNNEIADMTLDANYPGGAVDRNGIDLSGTGNAVRRVKIINCAHFSTSSVEYECWGICLDEGDTQNSEGNVIEDCEVSQYQGGGISAITMRCPGIMRQNRILLGSPAPHAGNGNIALQGAYSHHVLIEGNYVDGADFGFYCDNGGMTNVTLANNTLKDCRTGVYFFDNGVFLCQNVTFAGNTILLTTNAPGGSGSGKWAFSLGGSLATHTNINILGNIVGWNGDPQSFDLGYTMFLGVGGVQGLLVANNRVDQRFVNNITQNPDNNYVAYDNYDWCGNSLNNLNQRSVNSFDLPAIMVTNNAAGITLSGTFNGQFNGSATMASGFSGVLAGDVTGTQGATAVAQVGGQSAANVAAGVVAANAATSANAAGTIVERDASGSFSAGAVSAAYFSGNGAGLTNLNVASAPGCQPFFILPPDANVQHLSGGTVSLGVFSFWKHDVWSWRCPGTAVTVIEKPLPPPGNFWNGQTNLVSSWTILTTNAGTYSFTVGNQYIDPVQNGTYQQTVSFTAPKGTNVTTIVATNSIPTANPVYLDANLYLTRQPQSSANYFVLRGCVTAQ